MAVADRLVPTEQQLTDCSRLAASRAANSPYDAGVSSTVRWIGGLGNSPLTSQPPPASRAGAEQEFQVAAEVELEDLPLSAVISTATAQGVRRTSAWLLGLDQHPLSSFPAGRYPSHGSSTTRSLPPSRGGWLPGPQILQRYRQINGT